jgi:hypothetical protein
MAETLQQALAAEEERAVRDQFREGRWDHLIAVPLLDEDPDADPAPAIPLWQERVIAEIWEPAERPRARSPRTIAAALLIGLIVAAAIALVWAAQGWP